MLNFRRFICVLVFKLSPALRNRFTEIWCSSFNSDDDLIRIIEHNLNEDVNIGIEGEGRTKVACAMVKFLKWFTSKVVSSRCVFIEY